MDALLSDSLIALHNHPGRIKTEYYKQKLSRTTTFSVKAKKQSAWNGKKQDEEKGNLSKRSVHKIFFQAVKHQQAHNQ
jgi:hypothetical protein